MHTSNILKAFVQQTYGSLENARKSDLQADNDPYSKGNEHLAFDADQQARQDIASRLCENKQISKSMNIPSQLKQDQLNAKTQPHPNMKYDHSLEMSRAKKLGLIKLREMPTGDVESMYENMFNDDSNLVE